MLMLCEQRVLPIGYRKLYLLKREETRILHYSGKCNDARNSRR